MDRSHSAVFSDTAHDTHQGAQARQDYHAPQRPDLPQRRYDIMYLDHAGQLREKSMLARAHAAFEQAFCVLKFGSIVKTTNGFVSVEDVLPGDRLQLADGTFDTVKWRGSVTMSPTEETAGDALTRITPDALGFNRPSPDLVLGHGARILHRAAGIKRVSGSDAAFIPASDFVDGDNVLSLRPASQISMVQFGFNHQRCLLVNGIEVETLHPGSAFNLGLRGSSLRTFMSLFPHKHTFEDFGLMSTPRLRLKDLDLLG